VNTSTKDPFLTLVRQEARTHLIACGVAFAVLIASRYGGFHTAGSDAILLTPSPVGLIADFATAVLMLTFFRVLYGIPLWFVSPVLRRIGTYALFTLVFGGLFTLRTQQAIGARVEREGVRVFYPYPAASLVIPTAELSQTRMDETSAVSIIEIPLPAIRFIPAFQFDSIGQARLRSLFHALTTAAPPAA